MAIEDLIFTYSFTISFHNNLSILLIDLFHFFIIKFFNKENKFSVKKNLIYLVNIYNKALYKKNNFN